MNTRTVSIGLSLAGLMIAASADVLGGGMGAGRGMGGGMGGATGGAYGGMPSNQRGIETVPVERRGDASERGRGASSDRPATERQDTRQSAASKTPSELLQQNTRLSENIAKLLPAGTDLQSAASGFKNLGEFVAAAHVSSNLGIPFADLKAKILGGESLGGAIQSLRPEADGLIEARKARARAEDDLARS
jgi:hypothetical protein